MHHRYFIQGWLEPEVGNGSGGVARMAEGKAMLLGDWLSIGSGMRGEGGGTYSPATTVGALPQWSQNLLSRGWRGEREVDGRARLEKGNRARRESAAIDGERGMVEDKGVEMPCCEKETPRWQEELGENV